MVHNMTALIIAGWKAYCCILLFRSFVGEKMKKNKGSFLAGGCLLMFLELVMQWAWHDRIYIRAVTLCLTISFVMYLVFRIYYLMSLVLAMLYYGLCIIAECLSFFIVNTVFAGIPVKEINIAEMLVSVLLLWCGIKVLKKITEGKSYELLTNKEWRVLFISTFVTVVSFLVILKIAWQNGGSQNRTLLYSAIGILFIDFVVYCMANENIEREVKRREDEAFREKVKSEIAMYRSISDNLDKQRKRTHEYKNQIAAISALASEKKYEELCTYIEKIDAGLKFNVDVIDTNHVFVNAILNAKYREAIGKGVSIVLKINDLSGLNMEEEDIVIILSNLLDNAIEACKQCSEKVVKLKFVLDREQVVISVENSMAGKPVLKNGKFVSTKIEETHEHGFGIRNVIETVEKYGGRYVIDDSGNQFLFSILIANPVASFSKSVEKFPNLQEI